MSHADDIRYMQHALRLAARGLGLTAPNPSVGAVIVKDNMILGAALTARGGRPHAETQALAQAGDAANSATLYVTLEPCSHQGKTPPCTKAIIEAKVARVVVACGDSNPKVSGKGVAQLLAAGIQVEEGVCEAQARALNAGFFSVIEHARPLVTLKLATSLDGKIATSIGESKWITGEASRRAVHALRAQSDAIVTGIGTVLEDDPELTCRLSGRVGDSPQRIVLDSNLQTPLKAKILPAWIFVSENTFKKEPKKIEALTKAGSQVFALPAEKSGLSLTALLKVLAEKGITRLMVEAGGTLAGAFLHKELVDHIYWYRAPLIIGQGGKEAAGAVMPALSELPRYALTATERYGSDVLEIYARGSI